MAAKHDITLQNGKGFAWAIRAGDAGNFARAENWGPKTTKPPRGGSSFDHRIANLENLERAKGFEPSTPTLARSCSTTELHPHPRGHRRSLAGNAQSYAKCGPRMQQVAEGMNRPDNRPDRPHPGGSRGIPTRISPKTTELGSPDCKSGLQPPIKARAVLEPAQVRDIRRGFP
jgi:hypothetical protein